MAEPRIPPGEYRAVLRIGGEVPQVGDRIVGISDPFTVPQRITAERPTIAAPRMDPETIPAHREAGWTDFHPEDFCHRCGDRNPVWFAPADVWAKISTASLGEPSHAGIVCPACATELYEQATGTRPIWVFQPEGSTS